MQGKRWFSISTNIYFAAIATGFCALWFSPFVVSLATVLASLLFILNFRYLEIHRSSYTLLVLALFILAFPSLVDGIFSGFQGVAGAKVGLLFGFLLCTLAGVFFMPQRAYRLVQLALFFGVVVVLVNGLALSNYFVNKDEIDALLLQSKSIPIPHMHHIHFGIINAMCVLLLGGILLLGKTTITWHKWLAWSLLGVIFVSTHILSSRTGLLSLYVALVSGALYYAFHSKNFKVAAWVIIGLIVFSFVAYESSSSLRNKISNSIEDINSWGKDEEINHKSMAMRIEAYKASNHIIAKHPLGVGAIALDQQMGNAYTAINSPLWKENRIGPHNQILEFGAKYGWIGILSILLLFFILLSYARGGYYVYFSFVVLLLTTLQFESLLERQASLYFLAVFLPLFVHLFARKDKLNNQSHT